MRPTGFLLGISLTMGLTTCSLPASSQAISESVMLGAGSSTVTAKAGSALSSALNQSSKQLAGHVQQQISRPSQTKAAKNQTVRTETRSLSQPGTMIVSIQGAEPNCSLTKEQAAKPQGKASAEVYPKKCSSNASPKPESQKYNAVVTLSSPE
jgi:hypothetical protein